MDKPVIMLVDDLQVVGGVVKSILEGTYEVKTFTSGKEALEYLSDHSVDLILLDYEMPVMTGYEVLMAIRADKRFSKVPVIFLTAVTNERLEAEMLERGASDYVCKPIDAAVLRQRVQKHLSSAVK